MEINEVIAVIVLLVAVGAGEFLLPIHFIGSILSPPFLSVGQDWFSNNSYTLTLTNKEMYPTQMLFNITSDSGTLSFSPSTNLNDTTNDIMSPGDSRKPKFTISINNGPGTYTFVVHAYVGNGSTWQEVSNVTETLSQ